MRSGSTVEARKLAHDHPPTTNQRNKEHQHKSPCIYIMLQLFGVYCTSAAQRTVRIKKVDPPQGSRIYTILVVESRIRDSTFWILPWVWVAAVVYRAPAASLAQRTWISGLAPRQSLCVYIVFTYVYMYMYTYTNVCVYVYIYIHILYFWIYIEVYVCVPTSSLCMLLLSTDADGFADEVEFLTMERQQQRGKVTNDILISWLP